MRKINGLHKRGLHVDHELPGHDRGWENLRLVCADCLKPIDSDATPDPALVFKHLLADLERITREQTWSRRFEVLEQRHEAEQAKLRAELEAKVARVEAELASSERERHALQIELDETRHENGELMIENAVLRDRLGADPRRPVN